MATYIAADATYAAVNTAMGLCNDGDTLSIPAGSEDWTGSVLTVAKAISVIGAGTASTVLTNATITLAPGSNKAQSVSYIKFITGHIYISGATNGSYVLDSFRIHHNYLQGVTASPNPDAVKCTGWCEGLIDHNTFLNVNIAVRHNGDLDYAWARTIEAGTSHALFIEDNTFTQNDAAGATLNETIYHQNGARTVIRYNTFDASDYTDDACMFDSHGNEFAYYSPGEIRGQPIIEVYENTWTYKKSYRVLYIRGGSVLVWNNDFVHTGSSVEIVLTEMEGWNVFSPLRSAWPAQDQIFNSFFWGNTDNSVALTAIDKGNAADATFIVEDRDYFMHSPAAAGGAATDGKESFTDRPGASDTAPTDGDGDGTMVFTPDVNNAYYPYTPYTYPHPLQGGAASTSYVRIY